MVEKFDYDKKDDRLKIGEFRTKSINQVMALALAANAIPIALGSLFELQPWPSWQIFWIATGIGWLGLAISIFSCVIFMTSAPNWVKERARVDVLNCTYVTSVAGLFVGAIAFGVTVIIAIKESALTP